MLLVGTVRGGGKGMTVASVLGGLLIIQLLADGGPHHAWYPLLAGVQVETTLLCDMVLTADDWT
jgi:hypothetical protein